MGHRLTQNVLLLLIVGLSGACRGGAGTPSGSVTAPSPTQPATTEATTGPATAEPNNEPGTAIPDETAALPASTLFEVAWEEREIFRPGLIEAEQVALEQLPGATIYHMALQIESGLTKITGQQEVYYTNRENVPLDDIYFHLFPNLLGGAISVTDVSVNSEPVSVSYEGANDGIMRLPLPSPLEPGDAVVLQMAFTTEVPEESGPNFGVLAYLDDILALAHFYPMVAVYDDEGWNSEPPAEGGDVTYSDTSFYLARITAPSDVVVVAGGVEIGREEAGDSQALTFAAGPMRDFYLAASDRLTAVSDVVGQTNIHSYAPPELAEGAEAALQNASNALQVFSDRFGPYPFTELDIVSTSTLALGIEYPGIIAITLREYDLAGNISPGLPNSVLMESTVAHEVAHQWFYSLVGNDQLDEPWLDEALAQYATLLYYRDTYGENGAQGFYASLEGRWARVEEAEIPIGLPVGAYEDAEYGAIVYGRGPIFVDTLAQTMGQETFDAFLRDYAVTYRWDIARTEAMKQVAEEHCACDLTPLFAEWVYAE